MFDIQLTEAEPMREAVAQALDILRRAKARHSALQAVSRTEVAASATELDEATRAVTAAEERLAKARKELLAFFAA